MNAVIALLGTVVSSVTNSHIFPSKPRQHSAKNRYQPYTQQGGSRSHDERSNNQHQPSRYRPRNLGGRSKHPKDCPPHRCVNAVGMVYGMTIQDCWCLTLGCSESSPRVTGSSLELHPRHLALFGQHPFRTSKQNGPFSRSEKSS